jgi:hypothetical protein
MYGLTRACSRVTYKQFDVVRYESKRGSEETFVVSREVKYAKQGARLESLHLEDNRRLLVNDLGWRGSLIDLQFVTNKIQNTFKSVFGSMLRSPLQS